MCTCQEKQNKTCACWKKWVLLGLGLLALAGALYWYLKKRLSAA